MAVIINASTSTGLVQSADTSGIIQFQSNGSTKATLNSSGFSYPGAVLQVVQGSTITEVTSSTNSYVSTTLSASITPKSSSSQVLIMFSVGGILTASGTYGLGYAIYKGGSAVWTDTNSYDSNYHNASSGGIRVSRGNVQYLDSPATTSSTTYTIYFAVYTGTIAVQNSGAKSFITLMEIAA